MLLPAYFCVGKESITTCSSSQACFIDFIIYIPNEKARTEYITKKGSRINNSTYRFRYMMQVAGFSRSKLYRQLMLNLGLSSTFLEFNSSRASTHSFLGV
jgi:hypothetical protein